MPYARKTDGSRIIFGEAKENGKSVTFKSGVIVYPNGLAEAAKTLGIPAGDNDPLNYVDRVELIPPEGLRFRKDTEYVPMDGQTYGFLIDMLKNKMVI